MHFSCKMMYCFRGEKWHLFIFHSVTSFISSLSDESLITGLFVVLLRPLVSHRLRVRGAYMHT